jgi:4-nitrophenyl phosphatase
LSGGRLLPGGGSVVAAIETCAHQAPIVTGKPSEWFVEFVKNVVAEKAADCLMIGDRLNTDMAFGRLAGFRTLLVTETGVNTMADLEKAEQKPDHHLKGVVDLLPFL